MTNELIEETASITTTRPHQKGEVIMTDRERREAYGHEENPMTISALCIFSGDLPENNPDAAAEALRVAGYQVFRLPPELKAALELEVEGDDFIEVRRKGDIDRGSLGAMMTDVERVISPFGGLADCVGAASIEPFAELTRA
jgi:hypothetical protein